MSDAEPEEETKPQWWMNDINRHAIRRFTNEDGDFWYELVFSVRWFNGNNKDKALEQTWEPAESIGASCRTYCSKHMRAIQTLIDKHNVKFPKEIVIVPTCWLELSNAKANIDNFEADVGSDSDADDDVDSPIPVQSTPGDPHPDAPSGYFRSKAAIRKEYVDQVGNSSPSKRKKKRKNTADAEAREQRGYGQIYATVPVRGGAITSACGVNSEGVLVSTNTELAAQFGLLDDENLFLTAGTYMASCEDNHFKVSIDVVHTGVTLQISGTAGEVLPSEDNIPEQIWKSPVEVGKELKYWHQHATAVSMYIRTGVMSMEVLAMEPNRRRDWRKNCNRRYRINEVTYFLEYNTGGREKKNLAARVQSVQKGWVQVLRQGEA